MPVTSSKILVVASGVLNALLVIALLARESSIAIASATPRIASTSWCQPQLAAAHDGVGWRRNGTVDSASMPHRETSAAVPMVSPNLDLPHTSVDPARLKRLWYMAPHGPNANERQRKLEVHDPRWTFLDDRQMARGLSTVGDPQRLHCLSEKLLAKVPVHLSVLGGSVSFGTTFTTSRSRALFHWKVYQYINASFAGPPHEHYMGAVPASGPSYMEHCLAWHLPPPGADLILVEYAVNFDSLEEDAPAFERLIRRLLRLPNHPAIIIVNVAELVPPNGRLPWEPSDESIHYPSARDLHFDYKGSGAEDAIHAIADYYGVPCVSLRGAIFNELKANTSSFPIKQIYHDRHHPSAWGHSLLAQMVVRLLRDAIFYTEPQQRQRRRQLDGVTSAAGMEAAVAAGAGARAGAAMPACEAAAKETKSIAEHRMSSSSKPRGPVPQPGAPRLFAPIFARGEEAEVGECLKEKALEARIHKASGFKYLVEGTDQKMKPGVIGHQAGDYVEFCIDVSRLSTGAPFVFILGHLISYEHMGTANVSCVDECACSMVEIDAHVPGGRFSVFKAKTVHAKRVAPAAAPAVATASSAQQPCGCKVRVTILEKTGSGERKFKVLSLMTATKEGSLRYGHQAGFNNRPIEARFE